jgi:hypothetical protein
VKTVERISVSLAPKSIAPRSAVMPGAAAALHIMVTIAAM